MDIPPARPELALSLSQQQKTLMGPAGFGLFANSIYTTATTTALATVPLFIVMGEILFRSGAMEAVFDSLDRLVGRIRGRQYVLCILLSAILGALSGAAMAVAGLLGRSLLPEMRRGYNTRLSAGTILAGRRARRTRRRRLRLRRSRRPA